MRLYCLILAVSRIQSGLSTTSNKIAEIGATSVLYDDGGCQAVCDNDVSECSNDPHAHGSYCKFWQSPAVCFGMYVTSNNSNTTNGTDTNLTRSLCFQPNDPGCDDMVLAPLECPNQTNTTCASICSQTQSCVTDPNSRGSFCKTDNNVCFGLYWTDSSQTSACYEPNDSSCPATFPISCTSANTPTPTTIPTETSTSTTESSTGTTSETVSTESSTISESSSESSTESSTVSSTQTSSSPV